MPPINFKNRAEQVADYIMEQIASGRWGGTIPGVHKLADEVGVNFKTVNAAMSILEAQGALSTRGAGRRRLITKQQLGQLSLRVGILHYEKADEKMSDTTSLVHLLQAAGHHVRQAEKSLMDLAMDPERVARYVKRIDVDAWVVASGPREVLEWFALDYAKPVLALYGRFTGLELASVAPRTIPAMQRAVARLVSLGHRRIVMLCRDDRLIPEPGFFERAFMTTLQSHGIETSTYNLPHWGVNSGQLLQCISSLFKITPPTALICQEPHLMIAAMQRLARMGYHAPDDVSLICSEDHPLLSWCDPPMAHFSWDTQKIIRRVVKWVDNVANGREDRDQIWELAEFVEAGTVGPAPLRK